MAISAKIALGASAAVFLSACQATTAADQNLDIVEGPPVFQIKTPYDHALECAADALDGLDQYTIAVGEIFDATGKYSLSEGGNGNYLTQGSSQIMQSGFYTATPDSIVNRVDTGVLEWELGLGRTLEVTVSDVFATGAFTTLDFLPGGGAEVSVAGVSVRNRQYRMLVGLDLSLTDTRTSEVVANTALNKQIVATEIGAGIGRFFGETLVAINIGQQEREAVGIASRGMLYLGAFELLEQLYGEEALSMCSHFIDAVEGVTDVDASPEVSSLPGNSQTVATSVTGQRSYN